MNPDKNQEKKTTSEKPVSLWGAKFEEVLGALLKTPKPKKAEKDDNELNTNG